MNVEYCLSKSDGTHPTINVKGGLDILPKIGEKIVIFSSGKRQKFFVTDIEYFHIHSWDTSSYISNTTVIIYASSED